MPPVDSIAINPSFQTQPVDGYATRMVAVKSAPPLRIDPQVAFVALLSVSNTQVTVGFFALDRLHLDAADTARATGIALTVVGIALVLAQMLVRKLGWTPARLIRFGGVVSAVGFLLVMAATAAPLLWASYFVAAAGMGWVFASVTALAANSARAHEQGPAAGTISAAHGLGMIVGPLAGTLVYAIYSRVPYGPIGILLLLAALWPQRRLRRVVEVVHEI